MPGPGEYEPIGINKDGKFPTSTIKNVRYVFVDSYKQIIQPKVTYASPASCSFIFIEMMFLQQVLLAQKIFQK